MLAITAAPARLAITAAPAPVEHDHCLYPGCGRKLTARKSRLAGYGPTHLRRRATQIREAALAHITAQYTPEQVRKALELIADRGLIPTSRPGVFRAVASNGVDTYLVTVQVCVCRGNCKHGNCYHRAAAYLALAA